MDAVMASFSSSLSLSLSHPSRGLLRREYVCKNLLISSNTRRRHILKRNAKLETTSLPLEWLVKNPKNVILASAANSETSAHRREGREASDGLVHSNGTANNGSVVVDDANNSIIAEQPKRKRGRPKKVATTTTTTKTEEPAKSQDGPKASVEEEFDFFKELAENMKRDSPNSMDSEAMEAPAFGDDDKQQMNGQNVMEKIEDDETEWRAVSTGADTVIWPQGKVIKQVKETVKGDGWVIELENRKQLMDNTGDEETETINSTDRPKSNLGQEADSVLIEDKDKEKEVEEEEEEVDEHPLWVDEEDPTWPEEGEDGWGFRMSQFFDKMSLKTDKKKTGDENDDDDDDDDDELVTNWESEADDWVIKEIVSNDWEANVFADPSPLVVYVFARYGRRFNLLSISHAFMGVLNFLSLNVDSTLNARGMDGWKVLKELETAVVSIWESRKAPLRAVKVDIGMEVDLGAALKISQDDCPQLLFIKNGKFVHKLEGFRTSEEFLQYIAHFFYNGKRPSSLQY